ncbi:MAG: UvrB/UvrC motif-containing protein, partial [Phycisphaerae bacterium]
MASDWEHLFEKRLPFGVGRLEPKSLPSHGGVFLLADSDDRPVLLASAQHLRRAVTNRLSAPPGDAPAKRVRLDEIVRSIRWTATYSRFETDLAYWRIARVLYPADARRRVAFGPAWYLRADPNERTPHFTAVCRFDAPVARYIGPFARRRDADDFARTLEDVFDLCRYPHVLEQAPHGQACAYFDMGRCPAPCDGSVSLDPYRRTFAEALDFAAGRSRDRLIRVERDMKAAAARLEFERAASLKETLNRARQRLERPDHEFVCELPEFRWLILQRGGPPTTSERR